MDYIMTIRRESMYEDMFNRHRELYADTHNIINDSVVEYGRCDMYDDERYDWKYTFTLPTYAHKNAPPSRWRRTWIDRWECSLDEFEHAGTVAAWGRGYTRSDSDYNAGIWSLFRLDPEYFFRPGHHRAHIEDVYKINVDWLTWDKLNRGNIISMCFHNAIWGPRHSWVDLTNPDVPTSTIFEET